MTALKIMCADLALASVALLSGLSLGAWSVGAAVMMLALGILGIIVNDLPTPSR